MSLKESLKVLQALNSLPRKDAEEVVEAWLDQASDGAPKQAEARPCVQEKKRPVKRNRAAYTRKEIDRINQLLHSGLRHCDIAKTMHREFEKNRSVGAWEILAQRMARGYIPATDDEASND